MPTRDINACVTLEVEVDKCALRYSEGACQARKRGSMEFVTQATWKQGNATTDGRAYYNSASERLIVAEESLENSIPPFFRLGWQPVATWSIGPSHVTHNAQITAAGEVIFNKGVLTGAFPPFADTSGEWRIRVSGNNEAANNATSLVGVLDYRVEDDQTATYRIGATGNISTIWQNAVNSGGGVITLERNNPAGLLTGTWRLRRQSLEWEEVGRWNVGIDTISGNGNIDENGTVFLNTTPAQGEALPPQSSDVLHRIRIINSTTYPDNRVSAGAPLVFDRGNSAVSVFEFGSGAALQATFPSAIGGDGIIIVERFLREHTAEGGIHLTKDGNTQRILIGGTSHAGVSAGGENFAEINRWGSGESETVGQAQYDASAGLLKVNVKDLNNTDIPADSDVLHYYRLRLINSTITGLPLSVEGFFARGDIDGSTIEISIGSEAQMQTAFGGTNDIDFGVGIWTLERGDLIDAQAPFTSPMKVFDDGIPSPETGVEPAYDWFLDKLVEEGFTGETECWNTYSSCQDRDNYVKDSPGRVYKFCSEGVLLDGFAPIIKSHDHQPPAIRKDFGMWTRERVNVTLEDYQAPDTKLEDDYLAERGVKGGTRTEETPATARYVDVATWQQGNATTDAGRAFMSFESDDTLTFTANVTPTTGGIPSSLTGSWRLTRTGGGLGESSLVGALVLDRDETTYNKYTIANSEDMSFAFAGGVPVGETVTYTPTATWNQGDSANNQKAFFDINQGALSVSNTELTGNFPPTITPPPAWSSTAAYSAGAVVTHNGVTYRALNAITAPPGVTQVATWNLNVALYASGGAGRAAYRGGDHLSFLPSFEVNNSALTGSLPASDTTGVYSIELAQTGQSVRTGSGNITITPGSHAPNMVSHISVGDRAYMQSVFGNNDIPSVFASGNQGTLRLETGYANNNTPNIDTANWVASPDLAIEGHWRIRRTGGGNIAQSVVGEVTITAKSNPSAFVTVFTPFNVADNVDFGLITNSAYISDVGEFVTDTSPSSGESNFMEGVLYRLTSPNPALTLTAPLVYALPTGTGYGTRLTQADVTLPRSIVTPTGYDIAYGGVTSSFGSGVEPVFHISGYQRTRAGTNRPFVPFVRAYNADTKRRLVTSIPSQLLISAGITKPLGLWVDGDITYIIGENSNQVVAINTATYTQDTAKTISISTGAVTSGTQCSMWGNGETLWINKGGTTIFAYNITTRAYDSAKNITSAGALQAGLWGDGEYIWAGNVAYRISDRARASDQDFPSAVGTDFVDVCGVNNIFYKIKNDGFGGARAFYFDNTRTDAARTIVVGSHSQMRELEDAYNELTLPTKASHPFPTPDNDLGIWRQISAPTVWNPDTAYDFGSLVTYNGGTYVSPANIPAGIQLYNRSWNLVPSTGPFNSITGTYLGVPGAGVSRFIYYSSTPAGIPTNANRYTLRINSDTATATNLTDQPYLTTPASRSIVVGDAQTMRSAFGGSTISSGGANLRAYRDMIPGAPGSRWIQTTAPTFNANTTYTKNSVVRYNGQHYVALFDSDTLSQRWKLERVTATVESTTEKYVRASSQEEMNFAFDRGAPKRVNDTPDASSSWSKLTTPEWASGSTYNQGDYVTRYGALYRARRATQGGTPTYTEVARWNDTSADYRNAGDADYTNFGGASVCFNRAPLNNVADPFPLNTATTYRLRYVQGGSATQASAQIIGTPTQVHIDTSPGGGIACYRFGTTTEMTTAFGNPVSNPNSPSSFNGGQWILERQTTTGGTSQTPPSRVNIWRDDNGVATGMGYAGANGLSYAPRFISRVDIGAPLSGDGAFFDGVTYQVEFDPQGVASAPAATAQLTLKPGLSTIVNFNGLQYRSTSFGENGDMLIYFGLAQGTTRFGGGRWIFTRLGNVANDDWELIETGLWSGAVGYAANTYTFFGGSFYNATAAITEPPPLFANPPNYTYHIERQVITAASDSDNPPNYTYTLSRYETTPRQITQVAVGDNDPGVIRDESTFMRRWLSRNRFFNRRPAKFSVGYVETPEGGGAPRFVPTFTSQLTIDEIGIEENNKYMSFVLRDGLNISAKEGAVAPKPSAIELSADINNTATTIGITGSDAANVKVGDLLNIGNEIVRVLTASSNSITVDRAREGTEAGSHKRGDSAQICYVKSGVNGAEIIKDLIDNFTDSRGITFAQEEFESLRDFYFGSFTLSRVIPKPRGVNELIEEIQKSTASNIWYDSTRNEYRIKSVTGLNFGFSPDEVPLTDDDIIGDKTALVERPRQSITRALTFSGLRDSTKSGKDEGDWNNVTLRVDATNENVNARGESRQLPLMSGWINSSQARTVSDRLLQEGIVNSTDVLFEVPILDGEIKGLEVGEVYEMISRFSQNEYGEPVLFPFRVLQISIPDFTKARILATRSSVTISDIRAFVIGRSAYDSPEVLL